MKKYLPILYMIIIFIVPILFFKLIRKETPKDIEKIVINNNNARNRQKVVELKKELDLKDKKIKSLEKPKEQKQFPTEIKIVRDKYIEKKENKMVEYGQYFEQAVGDINKKVLIIYGWEIRKNLDTHDLYVTIKSFRTYKINVYNVSLDAIERAWTNICPDRLSKIFCVTEDNEYSFTYQFGKWTARSIK